MNIKPIRNQEDYNSALESIDRLFGAEPGTTQGDELDVLITLVEVYEKDNYPISLPDPVEAIKFHMERLNLTRRDLEPYIGSRARVSEILNRRRPLTLRMIRNLSNGLGISTEVLVQEYELQTTQKTQFYNQYNFKNLLVANIWMKKWNYEERKKRRICDISSMAENNTYIYHFQQKVGSDLPNSDLVSGSSTNASCITGEKITDSQEYLILFEGVHTECDSVN